MLSHFRKIIHSSNLVAEALSKRPIPKKKVVIDISSPEVAKTFIAGDLRSLLHGNFIQKMCRFAGYDVTTVNLVCDWGPQFALLTYYWNSRRKPETQGWPTEMEWTSGMSNQEKIALLAKISSEVRNTSKTNPSFTNKAQQLFIQMEHSLLKNGRLTDQPPEMELWREWCEISHNYLAQHYSQLGVEFDEWDWESNHLARGMEIVRQLIAKGLVVLTGDNLWVLSDQNTDAKITSFCKGDGSSMYLTRELGAICDRDRRFNADQYFYVVDKAQTNHFIKLKLALDALGRSDLAQKIVHHQCGTVVGLATKTGKIDRVDFLLEQGVKEAIKHLTKSPMFCTSEGEELPEKLCTLLTRSTIVFDCMAKEKKSDYTFTFKRAFDVDLNNAHYLQDKYVRLNALEFAFPEHMERIKKMDDVTERRLVLELNKPAQALSQKVHEFDTVVYSSFEQMEAKPLSLYLIKLANQIEKALPVLKVHGEPKEKALPRLILFAASKKLLGEGMRLIGVEPLEVP